MKKLVVAMLAVAVFSSCQQKQQYFTSSPEIDVIKQANAAYFSGDWTAFRNAFSDTAKIYVNVWDDSKMQSPDDYVKSLQAGIANLSEYKMGDGIYEMVVTDKGEKYVHTWFLWKGVHKNGTAIDIPVHLSHMVVGGKIVWEGAIYNALGAYLAENPPAPASTEVMK